MHSSVEKITILYFCTAHRPAYTSHYIICKRLLRLMLNSLLGQSHCLASVTAFSQSPNAWHNNVGSVMCQCTTRSNGNIRFQCCPASIARMWRLQTTNALACVHQQLCHSTCVSYRHLIISTKCTLLNVCALKYSFIKHSWAKYNTSRLQQKPRPTIYDAAANSSITQIHSGMRNNMKANKCVWAYM